MNLMTHAKQTLSSEFELVQFRRQFPILDTPINGCRLSYLDNAATSHMPQRVLSALWHYETTARANVQRGVHQLASRSTDAYDKARECVARYLNAVSSEEVVFTSGTTASVNLLAHSLGALFKTGDEVIISQAEHHSNYIPWMMLSERSGVKVKVVPVTEDGRIDMQAYRGLISSKCRLVAMNHASNVTGAVTDVESLVRTAHQAGALVFLDGAQAVPHGPVDVHGMDIDFYAFSGHKCYGPTGIGVLWGRQNLLDQLPPFIGGGGMTKRVDTDSAEYFTGYRRFEAGTPPIAQAVGLGEALDWLLEMPWDSLHARERMLTAQLLVVLESIPGLKIIGPRSVDHRLPLFSFDIAGMHPHDICHLMDQQGIALRGGHHCAQPLHQAFGLLSSTRVSLGLFNGEDDIIAFSTALKTTMEKLQ
jgi:cysteine desulfurase/selenocysteine lyase